MSPLIVATDTLIYGAGVVWLSLAPQRLGTEDWMLTAIHWLLGDVKGNMICLSGGVLSADAGTVGVEAKNLFSSFIARAGHELCVVLHYS